MAQRSGIDPGHLSKVERGEKNLSVEALHRLAVVLGLNELATLLQPYIPASRDTAFGGGAGSSHPTPPVENENLQASA